MKFPREVGAGAWVFPAPAKQVSPVNRATRPAAWPGT